MKLTDDHLRTFEEQGYVVVEDFYPEEMRAHISAAIRRDLPPWEELDSPPEGTRLSDDFPYSQMLFNELILDPDLIGFVQRVLETEDIHFRYAHNWARYPNPSAPEPRLHIDHGNNSLLPPCDDNRYGQISTWYFPEKVETDGAPMRVIPKRYCKDLTKAVPLTVEAGTLMIFNTLIWHTATNYAGSTGQRYSVTRLYGRADHYWEGVGSITHLGLNGDFREFIGGLTAKQRQIFRFPPPEHPYYTDETLALLESQYPGWNARGEYSASKKIEPHEDADLYGIPVLEQDRSATRPTMNKSRPGKS